MAAKDEEDEKKAAATGGLINDLMMGLGLRDRDQSYYDRTAATIGRNDGAAAENLYRQQTGMTGGAQLGSAGMPIRGGILSAFAGGQGGAQSRGAVTAGNFLPRLFGYRDFTDMTDRGGPFAFGGEFSGHPIYSTVANLVTDPSGTRTTYPEMGDIDQTLLGMGATQEMLTPMDYNQKMDLFRDMTRAGWKSGGQTPQDPRVTQAISDLRNPANWMGDQPSDQGLLPPATVEPKVDTKVGPDMMYLNAEQPLDSYLKRYDQYIDNVPPVSPKAVSADYGVTTQDDALDALYNRMPEGAINLEYSPQKHIILKSMFNPRYSGAEAEGLKYLLPPKVIAEQPVADTTAQPEPAMNFAQYVDAYRRREAPLVASGRLKRETPLDALRKSYNQFYGLK